MRKVLLLLFLISIFIITSNICYAEGGNPPGGNPPPNPSSNAPVSLPNPLGGTGADKTDIPVLLGTIINSVMGIIGSLALVMFIYGGVSWMLSAGNQEQVTKGKNILIWAAAGLVIIFTAYALVRFVLTTVTNT